MSDKKPAESKIWELEPESEFRFELDPGQSLAIKVRLVYSQGRSRYVEIHFVSLSRAGLKFSASS